MIIGDPSIFAIESHITRAFARTSFRALGFLVIHVSGRTYGIRSPHASMLACSLDEVQNRIERRGSHTAPFGTDTSAAKIADSFRFAVYAPEYAHEGLLDIPRSQLTELIYSNHLSWAPDGDACFDDGSYVLQFDVGDRVRLIAYSSRQDDNDWRHDPDTLKDQWLDANEFYRILEQWSVAFNKEWSAAPKVSET